MRGIGIVEIQRRELLRQFGAAAATTLLHSPVNSVVPTTDPATHVIRLDHNESAYGPSDKAKVAFQQALTEANRYPGIDVEDLRAAVAGIHGVQPENITLGCGSTELLRAAAEAWLGPGKSLVMASPPYDPIAQAAALAGAEVRTVPLNHNYSHDLGAMLAKIDTSTGLVYICNPNNPTGT